MFTLLSHACGPLARRIISVGAVVIVGAGVVVVVVVVGGGGVLVVGCVGLVCFVCLCLWLVGSLVGSLVCWLVG